LIREQIKAGLDAARARGKKGGRQPVSADDLRVKAAKSMHSDKSLSVDDICGTLGGFAGDVVPLLGPKLAKL